MFYFTTCKFSSFCISKFWREKKTAESANKCEYRPRKKWGEGRLRQSNICFPGVAEEDVQMLISPSWNYLKLKIKNWYITQNTVPIKYQNSYGEHVPMKMEIKWTDDFRQCGIFRLITFARLILCVVYENKRQTQRKHLENMCIPNSVEVYLPILVHWILGNTTKASKY
jgi:hypothetical protein